MKRASLKTAKVPVLSTTSLDVTDRILKTDTGVPAAQGVENQAGVEKKAAKPKAATPRRKASAPAKAVAPKPTATGAETGAGSVNPLEQAITQARLAVTALEEARSNSAAQYDIAIRYRLDALAHHLKQVADFVAQQAG